jgi:predicted nucleic acid-binding protein
VNLVIDSSVAVKWYVLEEGHQQAANLFLGGHKLVAPDLLLAETANVSRRKVRGADMTEQQAVEAMGRLRREFPMFAPSDELVERAFDLSSKLNHSVYDCIYLALALGADDRLLVTADAKFATKATDAGFGDRILDLQTAYKRLSTGQENDNG